MDLFKAGRGRPKKITEEEINHPSGFSPTLLNENGEIDTIDNVTDESKGEILIEKISRLESEVEQYKTEYQKLYILYNELKKSHIPQPPQVQTVVNSEEALKLESGARGLYKKFQDIATGNNKFKVKYDSVKILGLNGVLDEIRKHFSGINFSK